MRTQLILFALIVMSMRCHAQERNVEQLLTRAEPRIQARIEEILDAFSKYPSNSQRNVAAIREAQALAESVTDHIEIAKQVAIFAANPTMNEGRPLEARIVLDMLDLPPKTVIRALAPYLDAENESLRSFVLDWFQYHDTCGAGPISLMCLNYSDYLDYAQGQLRRHEDVPPAFIEYIYGRSPGQALLIFARANPRKHAEMVAHLQELSKKLEGVRKQPKIEGQQGIRPMPSPNEVKPQDLIGLQQPKIDFKEIQLAEHIVSNAIWLNDNGFADRFQQALPEAQQELKKLAEHEYWWARLYAAEIMRPHRELRDPKVLDKLREDSNELVSKAAKNERTRKSAKAAQDSATAVPLVAPREVEARAVRSGSVRVDWQPSVGATSYSVQRRQPDTEAEFTTIATNVTGTSFTDHTGESDTLYQYRVVAKRP
jgi:hypothetical protein